MSAVRSLLLLSFLSWSPHPARSSEALRTRGVGPDLAKFYQDPTEFPCLSNPLRKIPASQVNDDYCDCPDGSDEPGTSACSHVSPLSPIDPTVEASNGNITLALPGFYCQNKGHIPAYLPFISVNDGKCDYALCCDGSDEWQQVGGINCPSKCKEIGKEWRKRNHERKKALAVAVKRKNELLGKAANLRHSAQDRLEELKTKLKNAEDHLQQTTTALEEAEKSEKSKVVRSSAGNSGRVAVLAGLAKARVEELRSNVIEVRKQRDSLNGRVKELEAALSSMKQDYNANFNDEAVKKAVRTWEEYAARDQDGVWEAAKDRDLDEITKADDENTGINWAAWQSEGDLASGEVESVLDGLSAYAPPSLRAWLKEKLSSLRQLMIESGILADNSGPVTTAESGALTKARSQHKSAEASVTSTQKELDTAQSDLDKDYGVDDIFRALQGQCITRDSGEYTYELCFLTSTTQKAKRGGGGGGGGGSNTNLGRFTGITTEHVDEGDAGVDGKGLGVGLRTVLQYQNGQQCWSGPARSSVVVLACSAQEEIWRVAETEKCVYRFEVGTAAVCQQGGDDAADGKNGDGVVKDEL